MSKHTLLWFLAGWLLSLVFAPTALLGLFKSFTSRAS